MSVSYTHLDVYKRQFFDYACEHYSEACYNKGNIFSPFNDDIPEGLPQLFYDLQPLFKNAETAWTSWDDKLDSENLTQIADEDVYKRQFVSWSAA